jgi:hypothetical protein
VGLRNEKECKIAEYRVRKQKEARQVRQNGAPRVAERKIKLYDAILWNKW